MKKKIILIIITVLIAAAAIGLSGCAEKKLPSDIYITASDVDGAPAGEYYLPYTINNFNKYEMQYNLSVKVSAYLYPENMPVTVYNNRSITVEKENIYVIVVRLDAIVDGEAVSMTKEFTVNAEKADRAVTFMHSEEEIVKRIIVPYGGSIDMSEVPEVPDRYTVSTEGHVTEIVSKRWVVYDSDGNPLELNEEYLTDITVNIPVYSEYVYTEKPINYVIKFDTDGGSETADYNGNSDTVPPEPPTPVKEGYTFVGWCTDEEKTEFYNWKSNQKLNKNMTLYAKWVKNNTENATPNSNFNFYLSTDNYGNDFYLIEAKDKNNLVGEIILPNNYNGLPVRGMKESAFEGTDITKVTIPNVYVLDNQRGFADCKKLTEVVFEENSITDTIASGFFMQCTSLESIELPDSIIWIRPNAFNNCLALKSVKLPASLVFLNSKAFSSCKSLKSIVIPDSVQSILEKVFDQCTSLSEISIGKKSSLQEIEPDAFEGTGIKEITLPYRLKDKNLLEGTGITINYYPEEPEEPEEPGEDTESGTGNGEGEVTENQ